MGTNEPFTTWVQIYVPTHTLITAKFSVGLKGLEAGTRGYMGMCKEGSEAKKMSDHIVRCK